MVVFSNLRIFGCTLLIGFFTSIVSVQSDNHENFEFANEDDYYYDSEFDSGKATDDLRSEDVLYDKNDLSSVHDDGSRDGILSEEEQFSQENQFNPSEKTLIDYFKNPSSLFETPPYDVTKLSRGGRIHISFCTS